MASNAWKKSVPVTLCLQEDVGSFLREDGLVRLDLNKARGNVRKLDRALVGSLLGRRLPFWVVQNELQRKWGHFGLTQINVVQERKEEIKVKYQQNPLQLESMPQSSRTILIEIIKKIDTKEKVKMEMRKCLKVFV